MSKLSQIAKIVWVASTFFLIPSLLNAATIEATASGEILGNNTTDYRLERSRSLAGNLGSFIRINVVQSYQLPTLSSGHSFLTASISIPSGPYQSSGSEVIGIDLYALPVGSSNNIGGDDQPNQPEQGIDDQLGSSSQFFVGAFVGHLDGSFARVKLQDDFLKSGVDVTNSVRTSNDSANALFVRFLNAQYADGVNAGRYIYLRFNSDRSASDTAGFNIYNDGNYVSDGSATGPSFITYTTVPVPEPGTTALFRALHGL